MNKTSLNSADQVALLVEPMTGKDRDNVRANSRRQTAYEPSKHRSFSADHALLRRDSAINLAISSATSSSTSSTSSSSMSSILKIKRQNAAAEDKEMGRNAQ